MKSTALPAWLYGNPLDIIDSQRVYAERQKKADARQADIHRKHKSRRIKSITRKVIKGGGNAGSK
jgi:hypothetical protein